MIGVRKGAGLLYALGLAACGGAPDVEQLAAPSSPACGFALVPARELIDETKSAAARWSAATGCSIRIERGGFRVRLVEPMRTRSGAVQPGLTHRLEGGELVIDVTSERSEAVLPHEFGHLLQLLGSAPPPPPGHLDDGFSLMVSGGGEGAISEADLDFVCAGFPCAARVPEI